MFMFAVKLRRFGQCGGARLLLTAKSEFSRGVIDPNGSQAKPDETDRHRVRFDERPGRRGVCTGHRCRRAWPE